MRINKAFAVLFLSLTLAACGGGSDEATARAPVEYTYATPDSTGDGWTTGHLNDHGFDSAKITDMVSGILNGIHTGMDSVVIVRDSTLVLSENFRGRLDEYDGWVGNNDVTRHIMHSTSKSVTSALIGIAIDQGYIESTNVPFYGLFTYDSYENWDDRKSDMTLEDALTMRLGLIWDEWSEPYGDPLNDLTILTSSNTDYAKAVLDLPVESEPGTTYAYNTAATIAIGQALENSVGVPMADFAETHLFTPLQINSAVWGTTPTDLPNGGSGLFLKTRDMAKFGELFIAEGMWQGQQVISGDWVASSLQRRVDLSWSYTSGYGYQWWRDGFTFENQPIESWSTRGFGGQYIFCVPSLNLVVAFTGQNYANGLAETPFNLMQNYILTALENAP